MATAFRIVLGLALGAVAVAAYDAAHAPHCFVMVAIAGDVRSAYIFDECLGYVLVQPLPDPNVDPA